MIASSFTTTKKGLRVAASTLPLEMIIKATINHRMNVYPLFVRNQLTASAFTLSDMLFSPHRFLDNCDV